MVFVVLLLRWYVVAFNVSYWLHEYEYLHLYQVNWNMAVVHWQMTRARSIIQSLKDNARDSNQRANHLNRVLILVWKMGNR